MFLILRKSNLSIFPFSCMCLWYLRNLYINLKPQRFTPMFLPKNFSFNSCIRSWNCLLTFTYSMRKESTFILLHVSIKLSQHYLFKRLLFPPTELSWNTFHSTDYKYLGLYLDSPFYSIDLCLSFAITTQLDYYSFCS
jgi:hypothetical protein